MRVTHVINNLLTGGAETVLVRLVEGLAALGFENRVVTLSAEAGPLRDRLERADVPVTDAGVAPGSVLRTARGATRLAGLVRGSRPDLVQTWLYHSGVATQVALPTGMPILWNLRQSDLDPRATKRSTHLVARAGAVLARRSAGIVCASESAAAFHERLGYPRARMTVIPNGFETPAAAVTPARRAAARSALGVSPSAFVISRVGRWHPHKDHRTLVEACARLAREIGDLHVLLVGSGLAPDNPALMTLLDQHGLRERVSLLGERDPAEAVAASDVACSSSLGEGFPNVVGEAMAAGVPVVATDVGDSRVLLGDGGLVVPPESPAALAQALRRMASEPALRETCGARGRARIVERYSIERMVQDYARLYRDIAG